MIDKNYHCYAIYVIRHHEKRVCRWLTTQGVENIFPVKTHTRYWSDRIKRIDQPIFPSYLFVYVSCREYFQVLNNSSVIKYISFGGEATVIPKVQIESLRSLLNSQLDMEVTRSSFKQGESLTIMRGPLAGLSVEIVTNGIKKRLLLRIDEIGYSLLVNISKELLSSSKSKPLAKFKI